MTTKHEFRAEKRRQGRVRKLIEWGRVRRGTERAKHNLSKVSRALKVDNCHSPVV